MKTIEIGNPTSQALNLKFEQFSAIEVLYSFGGGIGGANKTVYATKKKNDNYTLLNGEEVYINPSFIVTRRDVELVLQVTDTTANANYHNPKVRSKIETRTILLPYNSKAEYLLNTYKNIDHLNKQGAKLISNIAEITEL